MEERIEQKSPDIDLRDIAKGYIRFSIRADDTIENKQVHEAFKEFCKVETDNNYTLGIRKLLEYYQEDYKTEMLHAMISEQNIVLADLRGSVEKITKVGPKDEDTF